MKKLIALLLAVTMVLGLTVCTASAADELEHMDITLAW